MYNILIVDDEKFVTDGLNVLLDEELEYETNIYCAYNSNQAISLLDKTRFDIVLLDINIPVINGVELQKIILKKWPFCKVIFLTAYENFEYAKSAINNKAVNYILKNEDDSVLISAIEKAIFSIKNENSNTELLMNLPAASCGVSNPARFARQKATTVHICILLFYVVLCTHLFFLGFLHISL